MYSKFNSLFRVQLNAHRCVISSNSITFFLFVMLLLDKCNAQSTVTYNRGIGKVFTWGWNRNGQLYLGDGVTNATVDSYVPGIVTNLPKSSTTGAPILISGLAASTDFSLVLSGDGLLFSVGDNMKGQLGLGDHTSRKVRSLSVFFF
jgi:alpha-tubulin suppressor-like RCC1 family protein